MSESTFKKLIALLLVPTALLGAVVSGAQSQSAVPDTQNSADTRLDDVIVTARKREEQTLDVPFAVQALSAEALAYQHVEGLADVMGNIPNLQFSSDRSLTGQLSMRGVGLSQGASPPGVGLYVDGVYQTSPAIFNVPLLDVERVEFAKGPQGTLYGRNSMAGAINITTRRPSRDFEADVQLEVGSGDTQRVALSIAGPVIGDSLFGRISGAMQRRDGFFNFSDGAPADINDYESLDVRLLYAPTDKFSADLKVSLFQKDGRAWAYHTVPNINDSNGAILLTPVFEFGPLAGTRQVDGFDNEGANLKLTYSFDGADLESITAYDDQHDFTLFDVDNLPDDIFHHYQNLFRKVFTQELRLVSTGDSNLSWLVGAYYTDLERRGTATSSGSFWIPLGGVSFPNTGPSVLEGYAAFGDLEYALNDQWTIGAGLRFDHLDISLFDFATSPDELAADTFEEWQPKASVKYAPTDDSRIYLTIARGFREGGFNVAAVRGTAFESFPSDDLWSYELGYKSAFQDGRGSVDAAIYYMDVKNMNGRANIFVPELMRSASINVPFGSVESYGAEVSLRYLATDHVTLSLDAGYNSAEVTELLPTALPGLAVLGQQVINAPEWSFRAAADWRIPVGDRMTVSLLAAVSGMGETTFQGSSVTGNLRYRDPYYLADLSAGLEWSRYRLSAFVKNLTDETFAFAYTDGTAFQFFGGNGTNHAVIYNTPRYYGLSFAASF